MPRQRVRARTASPRAPDRLARTCMSRRRSMPIFALRGFGPAQLRDRRAAYCVALRCFWRSLRPAAQSFRRIRLPCALALVSAPLWLGKRRRCPNHCAELRERSLRPRAACQVCSMASFWADFASVAGTAKMKQGLRRLRRLSGARLGMDHKLLRDVRKILECFSYEGGLEGCRRICNYAGTTSL